MKVPSATLPQIDLGVIQESDVILKMPKPLIASKTKQAAHLLGFVAVIDSQAPSAFTWLSANCARPSLRLKHIKIRSLIHVVSPKLHATHCILPDLRVLCPPLCTIR
jgi:hypothetical protein